VPTSSVPGVSRCDASLAGASQHTLSLPSGNCVQRGLHESWLLECNGDQATWKVYSSTHDCSGEFGYVGQELPQDTYGRLPYRLPHPGGPAMSGCASWMHLGVQASCQRRSAGCTLIQKEELRRSTEGLSSVSYSYEACDDGTACHPVPGYEPEGCSVDLSVKDAVPCPQLHSYRRVCAADRTVIHAFESADCSGEEYVGHGFPEVRQLPLMTHNSSTISQEGVAESMQEWQSFATAANQCDKHTVVGFQLRLSSISYNGTRDATFFDALKLAVAQTVAAEASVTARVEDVSVTVL